MPSHSQRSGLPFPGSKRSSVLSSYQQKKREGQGFECHQKSLIERICPLIERAKPAVAGPYLEQHWALKADKAERKGKEKKQKPYFY